MQKGVNNSGSGSAIPLCPDSLWQTNLRKTGRVYAITDFKPSLRKFLFMLWPALIREGYFKNRAAIISFKRPMYFAGEYHQDFYKKESGSLPALSQRRDRFPDKVCGKGRHQHASARELKERRTPLQYEVTQMEGAEPPFNNVYRDNKQAGIYVDIISAEPLFISLDKFRPCTGWPSFTRPVVRANII